MAKHMRETGTKICPVCGQVLCDDMDVCFVCRHDFREPRALTWGQLRNLIDDMPFEMLVRPVEVWVYADTEFYEGGHPVYDLIPYDLDLPISDSNYISMDIG